MVFNQNFVGSFFVYSICVESHDVLTNKVYCLHLYRNRVSSQISSELTTRVHSQQAVSIRHKHFFRKLRCLHGRPPSWLQSSWQNTAGIFGSLGCLQHEDRATDRCRGWLQSWLGGSADLFA